MKEVKFYYVYSEAIFTQYESNLDPQLTLTSRGGWGVLFVWRTVDRWTALNLL